MPNLKQHKFTVHSVALALMLVSAAMLYRAVESGQPRLTVALLAVFALANFLILLV